MKKPIKLKQALISVSDKTGLDQLAQLMREFRVQVVSTGGTHKQLSKYLTDEQLQDVSEVTGFSEILDGRVKTLHPAVHGGILACKDQSSHLEVLQRHNIEPIDLVVLNLYPFTEKMKQYSSDSEADLAKMIEYIDIGGITLLRAAAKNYQNVVLITSPDDYDNLAAELRANNGSVSTDFTKQRMAKAFAMSAAYDTAISDYFSTQEQLRYGENPHQRAAVYQDRQHNTGLAHAKLLNGKPLSYNNLADANAAWLTALDFGSEPVCVVLKHAQPCGLAMGAQQLQACERAFAADRESAFGGIVAFNTTVSAATAEFLKPKFLEVVIAPAFDDDALAILSAKKNLRLLQCTPEAAEHKQPLLKRISGGYLKQDYDDYLPQERDLTWVTQARLPAADLLFAWRVVKHCYSNAIVLAKDGQTLGLGAGQTSRVFSVRIAMLRAQDNGFDLRGAVAASDAFFPFADSVELLAAQGIKGIIQPGGSKRDPEVIAAADKHQMAMAFTGHRCFYHG